MCNRNDVVKVLLNNQADMIRTNSSFIIPELAVEYCLDRQIPLHLAVKYNHLDCVDSLLTHGIPAQHIESAARLMPYDFSQPNCLATKKYELQEAISTGNLTIVKKFAEQNPEWLKLPFRGIGAAIHLAAALGQTDVIKYIIDKLANEAPVNSLGPGSFTPLHVATILGKTDAVKTLLNHQADVNRVDSTAQTPLHFAVKHNDSDCIDHLLEHGVLAQHIESAMKLKPFAKGQPNYLVTKKNELVQAIKHNDLATIKKFVQQNRAWLTVPLTVEGASTLHLAVLTGNTELINYLLEQSNQKPSINLLELKTNSKLSPEHYAALKNDHEISSLLIRYDLQIKKTALEVELAEKLEQVEKLDNKKFKKELNASIALIERYSDSATQEVKPNAEIANIEEAIDALEIEIKNTHESIQKINEAPKRITEEFKKALVETASLNLNEAELIKMVEFLPSANSLLSQKPLQIKINSHAIAEMILKNPSAVVPLFEEQRLFELLKKSVKGNKSLVEAILLALPLTVLQKQEQKLLKLITAGFGGLFSFNSINSFVKKLKAINSDTSNLICGHIYNFGLFNQTENKKQAIAFYGKVSTANSILYAQANDECAHLYLLPDENNQIKNQAINSAKSSFERILTVVNSEYEHEFINTILEKSTGHDDAIDLKHESQEIRNEIHSKMSEVISPKEDIENPINHSMWTLRNACMGADIKLLKLVLPVMSEDDLYEKDSDNRTVLHQACLTGNHEIVKELLTKFKNPDSINTVDNQGYTAFEYACNTNNVKLLSEFIAYGAGITQQSQTGAMPLYHVCTRGTLSMIKVILHQKEGYKALLEKNNKGHTIFDLLKQHPDQKEAKKIKQYLEPFYKLANHAQKLKNGNQLAKAKGMRIIEFLNELGETHGQDEQKQKVQTILDKARNYKPTDQSELLIVPRTQFKWFRSSSAQSLKSDTVEYIQAIRKVC